MKWMGRRESDNVEDRRKFSGGKIALGGGLVGIIIIVINLLMGGDPNQLLQQIQQQAATQTTSQEPSAADDEMASFIKVALADNEDIWKKIFQENKLEYREPKLVLFRDVTQSGCGNASSAVGPFYCPADEKVYIDLSFFDELKSRFGAQGGDFAIAYVLAHEVGHHVQHLLGTSDKVHEMQNQLSETEANKLSVALELQADFYAGVWANQNQKLNNVFAEGHMEAASTAASALFVAKIQKKSQGYVVPDAFTHGTSEQRMFWFKKGFQTGKLQEGNTFKELNI